MTIKDISLISNIFGFMRFNLLIKKKYKKKDNFNIIIIGIPSEITCTGKPGSKLAPTSIRIESMHLIWEKYKWPWNFKLNKKIKIIDGGDLIYKTGNIKNLNYNIYKKIINILKIKKNFLILGGDHYITLPIIRACKKKYKKISLIHFDAHTDTYYEKNIFDHGSIFYQIKKEKLISKSNIIQIGIRTYIKKNHPFKIITSEEVNNSSHKNILKKIKKIIKKNPTYISFDIDCLDPSYAPGTGTPVINGINIDKILKIIRNLKNINIIGIDIVEVSPIYDPSNITSLTAATIANEFLHIQTKYILKKKKWKKK